MEKPPLSISGILSREKNEVFLRSSPCIINKKKWGTEYQIPGEGYCVKIMEVLPGGACSLHFHGDKSESFILVEGQMNVTFYTPEGEKYEGIYSPYSVIVLPKNTPHTFSVPADQKTPSIFVEASTPDNPLDSYRLIKSKSPSENV